MKMTGAEIFVKALADLGVDVVFGYPGGAVLHIYDELFKNTKVRHYLTRHEQGAVHMADGYARASGKTGVCLVTSGPGATNTVTGIATAYMDSIPIVVFSGQVPTLMIGNDAFQEADIVGITRPCTKHNYLVKEAKDLARIMKEAFYIASTGRPGPVLVDIPKDILMASSEYALPKEVNVRGYHPTYEGHPRQVESAVRLIREKERPVLYAGGGVILSDSSRQLVEFAHILGIPVTTTLMGMGAFPGTDPLYMGMLGMHGTYSANMAISHSDLIIAVGARFDDRVTGKVDEFAPHAKIIHVDIDPTSIQKNVPVDIPIVGDLKDVLKKMIKLVKGTKEAARYREKITPWREQVGKWAATHPLSYKPSKGKIKPQHVVEQIYSLTKGEAIITTEVGQNQMWAAQFYKFDRPRTFLSSGGLGTMGYGFPAAIGAQVAMPGRLVIDVAGDGSIQMNIQELATAVQYRLPVKVVILNNGALGMVRQWQELFFQGKYSQTCLPQIPDFVKLAEAYGAAGFRATRPEEVREVLKRGFAVQGPVFIDVLTDPNEMVYPMVPAGAPLTKMLLV
ncbi:MAG: acetolactate synthase, large subunit, biosynthetic type [Deltaproteobacteria bacterium RBG_16_64_85]|nr:MAG: acetolactate synthase, large subunit, biosynthetic type [Deltaproteobacteria bacterium RBG_16_64_85]